jgi:ADP-heptose:LPS heptosyltransferase
MWNQLTKLLNRRFFRLLSLVFPPTPKGLPKTPGLILVFSTTGIGDGLFDSAAIKSLKQGHPKATIIVCTHHRRGSMAKHNPFVDEVVGLSKSPFSQARLLWRFWREKPDLIVALRVNEEAVPLGYLLNRHAFVGDVDRCQPLEFLLSHSVVTKDEPHIVEKTLKVALVAGGASVDCGMVYQVHNEEIVAFSKRLPELLKKPYVVFQTGGGRTLSWRDWPPASYVEVIQWMRSRYPHEIILTGGHDNEAAGHTIAEACPWVINLVQKTTLEETAVLLQGAAMLVSSDTGVMHLGFAIASFLKEKQACEVSAYGCPTLAILHYCSPAKTYGPLDCSPGHEIIELAEPVRVTRARTEEMKQIPSAQVYAAIARILARERAGLTPGRG